jgi:DNA-binding transcriptional LysR family regulator
MITARGIRGTSKIDLPLSAKFMSRAAMEWERRIGRRLRLRDLHILSTVVERGSMAKAAAHLAVSQPAVSDAIANLEAALGVRLLDRGPHGVAPTIYADALLKRGNVVFDELMQGIRDIEFLANPNSGEVRVGCPESLAPVTSAIIDRLSRNCPGVVVHVVTAQPATLELRELRERRVDLLLGRMNSPSVADDDIDVEILFEDQLFVVAGARNRWTQRKKINLAELVNERWILPPPNNALSSLIARAFQVHGVDPPRQSATADIHVRVHLLTTGRYLTFLPDDLLQFVGRRWSLKTLPIDLGIQAPSLGVLTLRNRTLSPVAQLFIDCARDIAKSMADGTGVRTVHRRKPNVS